MPIPEGVVQPVESTRGERLRLAREALGLTQGELARLFELRRATVLGYEKREADAPLGYLSLLAGQFVRYHPVFAWLRDGGEMPRLEPRGLGTVECPPDPRAGTWGNIKAEMAEYDRRGEAAPTAQLAQWISQLRTTSADAGAAAEDSKLEALDTVSPTHGGAPPQPELGTPKSEPRAAGG